MDETAFAMLGLTDEKDKIIGEKRSVANQNVSIVC
jgi:hypothetical protein